MANIQPVSVWYKGEEKNANVFTLYSTYDNLIDNATFKYNLILDNGIDGSLILLVDDLSINGADYAQWDAEIDANAWIYNWAAGQLNLTII
jgi:hypothetical protein